MSNMLISVMIEAKDKFSKEFSNLQKSAEKSSEAFKNVGGGLLAVGTAGALALGGLTKVASTAEETQGKFNVVFRGMEKDMNSWADNFAGDMGRSKQEIKMFTGNMADILKPMGLTTQEASKMSKEMVALGLDLASFNNLQDTEVMEKFTAALTGERERLKSLGIAINRADVEQEAMRLGLIKNRKEMDKTIMTQATMSLMFANSKDAQGDLIRTQDSFANQLKRLRSLISDLAADLGTIFLPVANKMVGVMTNLVSRFQNLNPKIQEVIVKVGALMTALALIAGPILLIVGTIGGASIGFAALTTVTLTLTSAMAGFTLALIPLLHILIP